MAGLGNEVEETWRDILVRKGFHEVECKLSGGPLVDCAHCLNFLEKALSKAKDTKWSKPDAVSFITYT